MKPVCIIPDNAPDPSVLCRDGVAYLAVSTGTLFPGLWIYRSEDLSAWTKLARVCLGGGIRDVWAPDLCRHDGTYYLYFSADFKNWVSVAERPEGPWSEPLDLHADGLIDPGHAVDREGRRHLFFNAGLAAPLSADGLRLLSPPVPAYPQWSYPSEWETEGVNCEGPKLFTHGEYHYLIAAQGGTAGPPTSHMAVLMRSKTLYGGWEFAPNTPLFRTESAAEEDWSIGHATAFEGPDGAWHLVFHGYRRDRREEGRRTLLCDAEWRDGWLVPLDAALVPAPAEPAYRADFGGPELGMEFSFFGAAEPERVRLDGRLTLEGRGSGLSDSRPLLLDRTSGDFEITAEAEAADCECGITLYYNEACSVGICRRDGLFQAVCRGNYFPISAAPDGGFCLRLQKRAQVVSLWYGSGRHLDKFPTSFDVSGFHHNLFGGFLALHPGLYAAGSGSATFSAFRLRAL